MAAATVRWPMPGCGAINALWAGTLAWAEQHEQKAPERRGRARVHLSHSHTWQ